MSSCRVGCAGCSDIQSAPSVAGDRLQHARAATARTNDNPDTQMLGRSPAEMPDQVAEPRAAFDLAARFALVQVRYRRRESTDFDARTASATTKVSRCPALYSRKDSLGSWPNYFHVPEWPLTIAGGAAVSVLTSSATPSASIMASC